ncbi:MAG: WD40 repeat domain-containing protein [Gammaproteobacteria bacterium]|nr:WD40 repeat domain-containing protein [Gammaproteobacteria bacterium]
MHFLKNTLILYGSALFLSFITAASHTGELSSVPILRVETGMHTAVINKIDTDAAERFLLTASEDKTLRLWDRQSGDLLKIYRPPIGAGNEGKLYSGAISPDGELVAGAGWTGFEWDNKTSIYLFDRAGGELVKRLPGFETTVLHLCFSAGGQYFGAVAGDEQGVRVWAVDTWQEVFRDTEYAGSSGWCGFDRQNRLAVASLDNSIRLYSPSSDTFVLLAQSDAPGGKQPIAAAFSPAGDKIAVVFLDSTAVNVLNGNDLSFLYAPNTTGIGNGGFAGVAWSQDGESLYAGGTYSDENNIWPILHWTQAGQGNYMEWQVSQNTIMDICPLQNGHLAVAAYDATFAILDNTGNKIVERKAGIADYSGDFLISSDGATVQFDFGSGEHFTLSLADTADETLLAPDTASLNITGWWYGYNPMLDGNALPLAQGERSISLAVAPDKSKFLLGADWYLRLIDAEGRLIWYAEAPGATWSVNISGDGQKAAGAFGDGTIRWYDMTDGEELLTFFPYNDGTKGIAWTKSGYYAPLGESADKLIGWHVNKGKENAADFFPIDALYAGRNRPDIVDKNIVTLDEAEAVRLANLLTGDLSVAKIAPTFNQSVYSAGDHLLLNVFIEGEDIFDVYIGVILPDGSFFSIAYPLNFSPLNVLLPYKTGVQPAGEQLFRIFSVNLPPLAPGGYQACGILTKTEADPLDSANWLSLNCREFNFQ